MTKMPGDPCAVCSRASGAVSITIDGRGRAVFCSLDCSEVWMKHQPQDHNEKQAISAGGAAAGAYLDRIGKSDLSALTPAEWEAFCSVLFTETCADLRRQADDWIPW